MRKFIHAADIHLDSPMRGLPEYPGAPVEEIRGATRHALEAMMDLALEEQVDLVLIAGDLYDGDWPDYNTGLFLAQQLARLGDAGIRVVITQGNHDAQSRITRHLRLPDNVTMLSTKQPETAIFEDLAVAVHGQGFERQHVDENVVLNYPTSLPGLFNIGMLHTSAGQGGHEVYAPCNVQDLIDRGYQYWALGHVHGRRTLAGDPPIHFPGNLQGRNIREPGPKGCLLVTVDGDSVEVNERNFDLVRWELCEVSCEDAPNAHAVFEGVEVALERLLDRCPTDILATRVVIRSNPVVSETLLGAAERWTNEARVVATDVGHGRIWLEKLIVEPPAPELRKGTVTTADDTAVDLLKRLDLAPESVEALCENSELVSLRSKLPPELRVGPDALEPDEALIRELLPSARALVLASLQEGDKEE